LLIDRSHDVFPNPVTNILFIESDSEISSIDIFSSTGVAVLKDYAINELSHDINTSGLAAGVYIVKIKFINGKTLTTRVVRT
jgi:hypothetical protein